MTDLVVVLPAAGEAPWSTKLNSAIQQILDRANQNTAAIAAGTGGGGGVTVVTAASITDSTVTGRALITAADAAAGRTALSASSAADLAYALGVANAAIPASQKGAVNGVATLNSSGLIPDAQIPAIAVVDFLGPVATQVAMLALVGQKGDFAIRTDISTTWVITGSPTTSLASWTQLGYPTAPVTTVAGRTGAVSLAESDVANLVTDLAAKASLSSPTFVGSVVVPTPTTSGQAATKGYVDAASGGTYASAPSGAVFSSYWDGVTGVQPTRPTARADIEWKWKQPVAPPTTAGYALSNDTWYVTP